MIANYLLMLVLAKPDFGKQHVAVGPREFFSKGAPHGPRLVKRTKRVSPA
jgi:hypothetical protein